MAAPAEGTGSRVALFWLSGAVGTSMVGFAIIWPLIPSFAAQLGAGGVEIGLIIAAFNISQYLANPLIGHVSDRSNRKLLIAAGLLICSAWEPAPSSAASSMMLMA